LAGPADNSTMASLTPTLAANPVTGPDADAVSYCFQAATRFGGCSEWDIREAQIHLHQFPRSGTDTAQ